MRDGGCGCVWWCGCGGWVLGCLCGGGGGGGGGVARRTLIRRAPQSLVSRTLNLPIGCSARRVWTQGLPCRWLVAAQHTDPHRHRVHQCVPRGARGWCGRCNILPARLRTSQHSAAHANDCSNWAAPRASRSAPPPPKMLPPPRPPAVTAATSLQTVSRSICDAHGTSPDACFDQCVLGCWVGAWWLMCTVAGGLSSLPLLSPPSLRHPSTRDHLPSPPLPLRLWKWVLIFSAAQLLLAQAPNLHHFWCVGGWADGVVGGWGCTPGEESRGRQSWASLPGLGPVEGRPRLCALPLQARTGSCPSCCQACPHCPRPRPSRPRWASAVAAACSFGYSLVAFGVSAAAAPAATDSGSVGGMSFGSPTEKVRGACWGPRTLPHMLLVVVACKCAPQQWTRSDDACPHLQHRSFPSTPISSLLATPAPPLPPTCATGLSSSQRRRSHPLCVQLRNGGEPGRAPGAAPTGGARTSRSLHAACRAGEHAAPTRSHTTLLLGLPPTLPSSAG